MMGTCAYPGCGRGFERKRSDARYCSDTCRAKASKDRARARREGSGRRAPREGGAVGAGPGDAGEVAERLAAMEQRMAAAEASVARAEADRAGWHKVGDQLHAALTRAEGRGGAMSPEGVEAAARAEVSRQLAGLGTRLAAIEAEQTALRQKLEKATAAGAPAKAADLLMVGKELGKLNTRVAALECEVEPFAKGLNEALGDEGGVDER
jgi:hypothetical protein